MEWLAHNLLVIEYWAEDDLCQSVHHLLQAPLLHGGSIHYAIPDHKQTTNNNDLLEKYGGTKNCIYKD